MAEITRNLRISSGSLRNWLGIAVVLGAMLAGYIRLEDQVRHNHEDNEAMRESLALMQEQQRIANDSAIVQRQRRICAREPGAC